MERADNQIKLLFLHRTSNVTTADCSTNIHTTADSGFYSSCWTLAGSEAVTFRDVWWVQFTQQTTASLKIVEVVVWL